VFFQGCVQSCVVGYGVCVWSACTGCMAAASVGGFGFASLSAQSSRLVRELVATRGGVRSAAYTVLHARPPASVLMSRAGNDTPYDR
jgi:hypothetical protein